MSSSKKRSRTTTGAASAPKRKKPPNDWRGPLFYWRGTVAGTTWEGRWVASDAGLPSEEEFATSENTFKLECSADLATLGSLRVRESMKEEEPPQFVSGSYKLDNGEGLADYSDLEHKLWAVDGPPSHHPSTHEWAAVGACGDTEFGRFVSLGRLDKPSEGRYTRLTLARRYIDEKDPRTAMGPSDVVRRVAGVGEDSWAMDAPWLALPWKVPRSWPAALPVPDPDVVAALEANCEKEGTEGYVGIPVPFY